MVIYYENNYSVHYIEMCYLLLEICKDKTKQKHRKKYGVNCIVLKKRSFSAHIFYLWLQNRKE
jgi:hypothetical protein